VAKTPASPTSDPDETNEIPRLPADVVTTVPAGTQTLIVQAPKATGTGWKVATFVFGTATVILAIMLSGQLIGLSPLLPGADPGATPQASAPAPAETASAPPTTDANQIVGEIGLQIMSLYNAQDGWPATVEVDGELSVVAEDGTVLGEVPSGTSLTYELIDGGAAFSLVVIDVEGETAEFNTAALPG